LFFLVTHHITRARVGAAGLDLFQMIMYTNMVFLSILAVTYVSSAIAEEKEQYTLGLLRMTRLDPISILLGKGLSRMNGLLVLFLAQAPFALLAVTLGGVAPIQVAAACATLVAYLILISGIAIFASVISAKPSSAGSLTVLLLILFHAGPGLLYALAAALNHAGSPVQGLAAWAEAPLEATAKNLSPFFRMSEVMTTGFGGSPFGYQVLSNTVLGMGFFLLAWRLFERFSREQKDVSPRRGLISRGKRWRFLSPGPAWSNPIMWKDFNFLAGGRMMIVIKMIFYPALIGGIAWLLVAADDYRTSMREFTEDILPALAGGTMAVALAVELLFVASKVFNAEMKWGTIPNLGVLPITIRRIARDKVAGCLLGAIPAFAYFLLTVPLWIEAFIDEPSAWLFVLPTVAHFAFILSLTALLSVYIKNGAVLLALFITWFGLSPLSMVMGLMLAPLWSVVPFLSVVMSASVTLGLAWFAIVLTLKRLRKLAA